MFYPKPIYGEDSTNTFKKIYLMEFYDNEAYLIDSTVKTNFLYEYKRFTPTIEEVKYTESRILYITKMLLGNNESKKELLSKNFRKYYRQYLGIINNKNEKIIMVNYCNLSNKEIYDENYFYLGEQVLTNTEYSNYSNIITLNLKTGMTENKFGDILNSGWLSGNNRDVDYNQRVNFNEFYDNPAVIFPSDYLIDVNNVQRVRVGLDDIYFAESKILYYLSEVASDGFRIKPNRVELNCRQYYRQYYGIYTKPGKHYLVIQMCDLSNPDIYNKYFPLFFKEYIVPDAIDKKYFQRFIIDLYTGELDEQSDPLLDEGWFFIME